MLPLAFDYGLYQLLMTVPLGATLVLERSFAFPAQIVKRMQEEEVTVFPGVPDGLRDAALACRRGCSCELPTRAPRDEHRRGAAGRRSTASCTRSSRTRSIFAMYGLTECKRVSYLEPELLDEKPTSVGKAIPGTETIVARRGRRRR